MSTIHLISHTHWDREWYLTFQQFRTKLVHLIDGLLELLENDPDFKFFMLDGQTIVLDDYLQIRPEREAELRAFIQEGRILIGPWHILPDEFLVSPESTIRNLLQGDRTARRFGPKMMVGYIPDPFGHIGQIPQILQGFGIQEACLQRGLWEEPCEFWWRSPDGSRVLMLNLRDGYGNAASLPTSEPVRFVEEVCRLADSLREHSCLTGGDVLLMHGTDHMEPPPDTSAAIAYANQHLGADTLVHSTLPQYIASIRAAISASQVSLPEVTGELRACQRHHLLPGVLSARMWVKQRNQACETLLEKWAEPFSTYAELASGSNGKSIKSEKPSAFLRESWRLLMECHPHDSICGCSIDQVHEEMRPRFDQVEQLGEEITRRSLEMLAGSIRTEVSSIQYTENHQNDGRAAGEISSAVIVFNPSPNPRTDLVTVPVDLPAHSSGIFDILDETGKIVAHQSQGMGSRELIHMEMDRKEMQEAYRLMGMVHEGRVAGMVIKDIQITRQGSKLLVQAIMADQGEPNLEAWEGLKPELERIFQDTTLETFAIRAFSTPATSTCFIASQVPGSGYRTYWVRPQAGPGPSGSTPTRLNLLVKALLPLAGGLDSLSEGISRRLGKAPSAPHSPQRPSSQPPFWIENELFRVEASAEDGTLSIQDKRSGCLYQGLNRLIDGGDCGDEYNFSPPAVDTIIDNARVRRVYVERGPLQQTMEIELLLSIPGELAADRKSRSEWRVELPVTTRVSILVGVPRVDIHTEVDHGSAGAPRAKDHRLRAHFPAHFRVEQAAYDGHFEIVQRPITALQNLEESWVEQLRPEKPQRGFTAISDGRLGLLVANRGLPEVEALQNGSGKTEIALTLIRCVGWLSRDDFSTRRGHAGPSLPTPGAQMPGKFAFDYSILPFTGSQTPVEQAYAFETPMRALNTPLQAGNLPSRLSFLRVEPAEFALSAVKTAEDGSGWIVRGYNLGDSPLKVRLAPWKAFSRAERISLAELSEQDLAMEADGSVCLEAGPHQIVTVKFS